MSGYDCVLTQLYIPEEYNHDLHQCKSLKYYENKMLKQKFITQNKKQANFKESKQTSHRVKIFPITAVPLQARSGPEGFTKLRFPDYVTTA